MKTIQYQDFSDHPLMLKYRLFRRGFLALPHLEANLILELEKLSEVHVPVSKVPVEREFLVNSLRTIRQEIRKTYQPLASLKRSIKRSKVCEEDIEKAIAEQLEDSPHARDILVRIKSVGGVNDFLEGFLLFLRPRYDEYSKCIDLVNKYYDAENEDTTLAKLALKVESCIPSSPDVMYRLCWNPLSCIVAAAVVIITIIVLEGEAEGEEEGEIGDFPEPDPDGPRPA